MAFPMQLPVWDTVRLTIEGNQGLEGTAAGQELLDENAAELWVASRCIDRSQTLKERFGSNEKTKVIAKLQVNCQSFDNFEPDFTTINISASWSWCTLPRASC